MKRKRFRESLLFALLFFIFLMIMDYPFLAGLYHRSRQGEVAVAHQAAVKELPDSGKRELLEKAEAYNGALASGMGMEQNGEYESLLNAAGDGVMGRIRIPKIGVDLLIYHGTSEEVLQRGAGHLEGSSLPVGGVGTHACISAHRGLAGRKLFTSLDEMEEGDLFFLHILDEKLCYRVEEIRIVLPEETECLAVRDGEDLVTLSTCTPYGINTHRLCVEGRRISCTEEAEAEAGKQEMRQKPVRFLRDWFWLPLSLFLILAMSLALIQYNRKIVTIITCEDA